MVKIVRVLKISKDVLFKGVLQNFFYHAIRANNVAFNFSVADFPLINLNDLISVARILKGVDISNLQMKNKEEFLIRYVDIMLFIDNYYDFLPLIDVELALAKGKQVSVPQSMLKGQGSLKTYEDGEICTKPLGIVFTWKNKKGKDTKFLFQAYDVERYTSSQYTNLLVRINSCNKKIMVTKRKFEKQSIGMLR